MGTLYYGDNLDILRRYLKDETLDLVYLDPPFNSAQSYNALAGTRLTLSTRPSSYIPRFACRAARTIRRKATGRQKLLIDAPAPAWVVSRHARWARKPILPHPRSARYEQAREMISYQYQFLGGALAALHTSRRPPYLNKTTTQPHQMRQQPMKRNLQTLALPAAIAASLLFGCSTQKITDRTDPGRPSAVQAQEGYDTFGRKWGNQPPALSRNDFVLLNYTGTITDIDYSDREMTLKGPQGRLETFVVDKKVQRFSEAKVGDKVSIDYYLGFNAEVRKPTAEEEKNPLVVLDTAGKAGPDAPPAAYGMRQIRAVVTIESLDRSAQTVTVKGPRGKYFVARVADPSRLEQVHIGDTILMTFTEAAAISLKPAGNETAK